MFDDDDDDDDDDSKNDGTGIKENLTSVNVNMRTCVTGIINTNGIGFISVSIGLAQQAICPI